MEWGKAQLNDNAVKIPDRWLHLYYYEALNILFRFENALRIFVYVILKRELGKDWDLAAVGDGITIRTETKKRIAQARDHGYLGYEVTSPVLFLNSGELTQILTSDAYWKYFAPYFKASKAIVLTKLQEIGTVRNSLAHFRPVKQDELELIKQNSKHVLLGIEDCLSQILKISDPVPTNSDAAWYKNIKPIGGECFSTDLFLSKDSRWVRVALNYNCPTLKKQFIGETYVTFELANIQTPQMLKLYPAIRDNCVFVSESPAFAHFAEDSRIQCAKEISMVFASETLAKSYEVISEAFRGMAIKLGDETNLLKEDSLARGELVDAKNGHALYRDGQGGKYWSFDVSNFPTAVEDVEEVEFWGQRTQHIEDFVASAARYPWMPSTISKPGWFEM